MFTETPTHATADMVCPKCASPRLDYDADTGHLTCPQCGYTQTIQRVTAGVVERDLTAALRDPNLATGYGRQTRAIKCRACEAITEFDPTVQSGECPFCGSTQVFEQPSDQRLVRPESLIPFQFSRDEAFRKYQAWLGRGFFRPRDVLQKSGNTHINGVYLPFWTFDAQSYAQWSAESGTYYYVTESYTARENGRTVRRTRQVRKTRWRPAFGERRDTFDDVLVPASTSGDQRMLRAIEPFDTKRLVAYQPDFLAGWAAEAYRVPLNEAWGQGRATMLNTVEQRCAGDVPGDTYRNLSVRADFSNTTFKHVLLPVFLAHYTYNGQRYNFMVNGQTGEVQGQAPVDWLKVLLVVLAVLVVVAVLAGLAALNAEGAAPTLDMAHLWLNALVQAGEMTG